MCPAVITSEFVSTSGEPSYGQRWLWMLGQEVQGPLMSRAWGEKGEKTDFKAKEGQFSCNGGWAGSRAGRQWGCGMRGSRSTGFTLGQAFLRRVLGKPMQSSTLFILSLPVLLFFFIFPFWNTDRTLSFHGAVCWHLFLVWIYLFILSSSYQKGQNREVERCGLNKPNFLQLTQAV